MNWWAFVLVFIGGIILTVGDIFMKKWVVSNSHYIYLIGMSFYIIGLIFLAFSFKFENIAIASVMIVLFNIISLLLFSYLYFKEKLSGFEIIGITLGILAIIMLEIKN